MEVYRFYPNDLYIPDPMPTYGLIRNAQHPKTTQIPTKLGKHMEDPPTINSRKIGIYA